MAKMGWIFIPMIRISTFLAKIILFMYFTSYRNRKKNNEKLDNQNYATLFLSWMPFSRIFPGPRKYQKVLLNLTNKCDGNGKICLVKTLTGLKLHNSLYFFQHGRQCLCGCRSSAIQYRAIKRNIFLLSLLLASSLVKQNGASFLASAFLIMVCPSI